jgi:hypothetical protein
LKWQYKVLAEPGGLVLISSTDSFTGFGDELIHRAGALALTFSLQLIGAAQVVENSV